MRMTPHAWQRWRERHPDLDPGQEFSRARRAGKRLRLLLCGPEPALGRFGDGRQYFITDNDVVFVVNPAEDVVITVLRLGETKRRARALRRAQKGLEEGWVR